MPLLSLHGVSKSYGAQAVFTGLSFQLEAGEKVGLIGPNGSGKTTLLRIIAGELEPDAGAVHLARGTSTGYLAQRLEPEAGGTLRRCLEEPLRPLLEMKEEMAALEREIAAASRHPEKKARLEQLLARYGTLSDRFSEEGGYEIDSRLMGVAQGLGFSPADLERELTSFSGGEKKRAHLAFLLLQEPDLLLLDEPTNFLDMEALFWLEKFLHDWRRAILVVSHDRYFLDRVVGRILALQDGRLKSYSGNYSAYLARFQQEQIELARAYRQRQELLVRETRLIRESKADERSKRQARSRQKRLEKLEQVQRPLEVRSFKVGFDYSGRGSDLVIAFEGVAKSFGGKTLFKDLHFEIRRGERVALVGPNGAGKSTLLKMIAGEIKPSAGRIKLGPAVKVVYFSQEQEQLDPARTLVEEIIAASELDLKEARSHLAAYLFQGDEVFKKVGELSGGEKSRFALARLALSEGNCLLMDEPTSHLDLPAVEQLERSLQSYPGTFIVISHDRYFLDGLVDRVILLKDGAVSFFAGGFGEFLQAREELLEREEKKPVQAEKERRRQVWLEQKERQRRERKLASEQERLEALITESEEAIARLERSLADPERADDYQYLTALGEQLAAEKEKLSDLLQKWEEVSNRLEEFAHEQE